MLGNQPSLYLYVGNLTYVCNVSSREAAFNYQFLLIIIYFRLVKCHLYHFISKVCFKREAFITPKASYKYEIYEYEGNNRNHTKQTTREE